MWMCLSIRYIQYVPYTEKIEKKNWKKPRLWLWLNADKTNESVSFGAYHGAKAE